MEKCIGCELCAGVCPGRLHLRARRRQPARPTRSRPASATASSTRSTTCAASTATCAWRRARPRRSPRPSCSSSPSPTAPTPSTPRTSCWSTTTAGPSTCRGRTGARATTCTPRAGCGPPRRRASAAYEGRVQWSGELGYGVRAPEGGQSRPARRRAPPGAVQLRETSLLPPRRHRPPCRTSRGCEGSRNRLKAERIAQRQALQPDTGTPARQRRGRRPTGTTRAAGPTPAAGDEPRSESGPDARWHVLPPARHGHHSSTPVTFAIAAAIVLAGAVGVVVARNPCTPP